MVCYYRLETPARQPGCMLWRMLTSMCWNISTGIPGHSLGKCLADRTSQARELMACACVCISQTLTASKDVGVLLEMEASA